MGRKLLGYRVRGTHAGSTVYAKYDNFSGNYIWSADPNRPLANEDCSCFFKAKRRNVDTNQKTIEVSEIKIVAVYLKTNEYESLLASHRTLEDLSEFNRAVVEEIDRRGIDAIVEPLSFVCMPTTLRFRAPNGGFVWIPILAFSVVDGPKDTRAGRTVDRMLAAIESVAKNLSGIDTGK